MLISVYVHACVHVCVHVLVTLGGGQLKEIHFIKCRIGDNVAVMLGGFTVL